MSTYLWLMLFSFAGPFVLSFDKKVAYYKKWKYLFPSILIVLTFFVVWDVAFTEHGIWSFNPSHVIGINLINLPLEEWLFFIIVPFASVFIYECLNAYIKKDILKIYSPFITIAAIIILVWVAFFNLEKSYTSINFITAAILLSLHAFVWKSEYLSRFWLAYFVHLIPFFIINGILTAIPVVIYDNAENLGIRLYTIPIEDTAYALTLLLGNITIMEFLQKRKKTIPSPK